MLPLIAITGVIDEFAAISKKIAATLDGGKPEKLLALVSDLVDRLLDPARKKLQAVKEGAEAAVAEARRAGQLSLGGSGAPDLAPPSRQEPDLGGPLSDPEQRLGSSIKNENAKSKFERFHETAVNEGDGLAKDGAKFANQIHDALNAKDPGFCVALPNTAAVSAQPPPPGKVDAEQAAGTILDTAIFIMDAIVLTHRKARRRER